jgi:hypothetical protein
MGAGAEEEETEMEVLSGDDVHVARMVAEEGVVWMRLSISSMSYCIDKAGAGSCRRGCAGRPQTILVIAKTTSFLHHKRKRNKK